MTAIDYKALAERIALHADLHEDIAGDGTNGYAQEQRGYAVDLRTVVSLLEGMANAEPIYFVMSGDSWVEVSKEVQARHGTKWQRTLYTHPEPQPQLQPTPLDDASLRVAMNTPLDAALRLQQHYEPQPQPERQPVSEPTRWKVGNELAPYHPDASHVEPGYRDGWNACYRAMQGREPTEAQIEAAADVIRPHLHEDAGPPSFIAIDVLRAALAARETK